MNWTNYQARRELPAPRYPTLAYQMTQDELAASIRAALDAHTLRGRNNGNRN